jgi:hypothetical protein
MFQLCLQTNFHIPSHIHRENTEATKLNFYITIVFENMPQKQNQHTLSKKHSI